jgi:hypothetical protein
MDRILAGLTTGTAAVISETSTLQLEEALP